MRSLSRFSMSLRPSTSRRIGLKTLRWTICPSISICFRISWFVAPPSASDASSSAEKSSELKSSASARDASIIPLTWRMYESVCS